jgi:hypothetical protein
VALDQKRAKSKKGDGRPGATKTPTVDRDRFDGGMWVTRFTAVPQNDASDKRVGHCGASIPRLPGSPLVDAKH